MQQSLWHLEWDVLDAHHLQGESLEQAAYVHGMDLDELLGRLNEYAQTKEA